MSHSEDQLDFTAITRICQFVVGALIAGVSTFLTLILSGIVTPERPAAPPVGLNEWPQWPLMTAAILASLIGIPASILAPRAMVASSRWNIARGTWPYTSALDSSDSKASIPATDAGKLAIVYQTQLIVGSALNEGLAFFSLIAYLVEGQPVLLGLAVVLILGLTLRFPTVGLVREWVESQLDLLHQERQSAFRSYFRESTPNARPARIPHRPRHPR